MNVFQSATQSRSVHRQTQREGSVALILILVLTLLVGTFTISATTRISHERQIRWNHRSVTTLESAIESVASSSFSDVEEIRLPLDDDSKQWVIVEVVSAGGQTSFYQATLYRDGEAGMFIRRPR